MKTVNKYTAECLSNTKNTKSGFYDCGAEWDVITDEEYNTR